MNTNKQYKASVFAKLFSDKENLLELYNAIENTNYGKDTEIQITTLDNVLYMEQINDISFLIDGKIVVLIEHQSTINPNMPLRMLLYMARIYEKITESENLYSTNKISVARPEFIVLYNGTSDVPDKQILKLSEMFEKYGEENPVNLELIVKVFNINNGRNPEFAAKSEVLNGYEKFISAIRENEKTMSREEAMKKAVEDCIKQNILRSFLENNATEVINMLLTEWNWDDVLRVRREDGIKEGMQKGMQQMLELLEKGLSLTEVKKQLGLNGIKSQKIKM